MNRRKAKKLFKKKYGVTPKKAALIIREAFERMVFICKEMLLRYKELETAKEESK